MPAGSRVLRPADHQVRLHLLALLHPHWRDACNNARVSRVLRPAEEEVRAAPDGAPAVSWETGAGPTFDRTWKVQLLSGPAFLERGVVILASRRELDMGKARDRVVTMDRRLGQAREQKG